MLVKLTILTTIKFLLNIFFTSSLMLAKKQKLDPRKKLAIQHDKLLSGKS